MLKIALTYNLKRKVENGLPIDYFSEFDSPKTVEALASSLRELDNEVYLVEANSNMLRWFLENKVDIVFNIAEGFGPSRESQVPAILDFLKIPYIGSGVFTLALALDKAMAKKIFKNEAIPTPNFQLFSTGKELLEPALKFPLIVKPNAEGSAKGITISSVVNDQQALRNQVEKTMKVYKQPALVEEFIKGRELTVGILGNETLTVLPILEIDFKRCKASGEYFYSWRMKEYQGNTELNLDPVFTCPANLAKDLKEKIEEIAIRCHRTLNCFDFSRVDIRLEEGTNVPYVLEINPLPGLDPWESNLTIMSRAAGMAYTTLIDKILKNATNRYGFLKKESVSTFL